MNPDLSFSLGEYCSVYLYAIDPAVFLLLLLALQQPQISAIICD